MREERERLEAIAEHLGITARFERELNQITIEFEDFHGAARFRQAAWPTDRHSHVFQFAGSVEAHGWINEAEGDLVELGLDQLSIEYQGGGRVRLMASDFGQFLHFMDLELRGHRKAAEPTTGRSRAFDELNAARPHEPASDQRDIAELYDHLESLRQRQEHHQTPDRGRSRDFG